MISAVLEISFSCQGSNVSCFCYVMRFPSAVLGRVDSFSWETTPPLYFLFRTFLILLWGWWFVWGTLTELCRSTQDTAVRRLVTFKRILRPFQINLTQSVMMVLHVEVGLRVGVRIDWRYEWRCTVFPASACSKTSSRSPPYFNESSSFESPMWYSKVAYPFSIFLRETLTYPGSREWHCRAPMYTGSSRWKWCMISDRIAYLSYSTCLSKNLILCQSSDRVRPSFFFLNRPYVFSPEQCSIAVTFSFVPCQPVCHSGGLTRKTAWAWNDSPTPLMNWKMLKVSPGHRMWHLVSLLTSHCFDFSSEWQCWLTQAEDNFELLLSTYFTQGCSCLAPSHQCLSFLPCWKDICDRPSSASGTGSSK